LAMGKYGQLVMGPAGCGKSTYCTTIYNHCVNIKRSVHIVNLDPAAEVFNYPVSIDVRDLITIDDVMEKFDYGPNGALVYCMEYLINNMSWLHEQLSDFEDDYLIFDLPGQIELYTHINTMKKLISELTNLGYKLCALYLLDSQFLSDSGKFLSGSLQCLSAMIHLELPHVNIITKMDQLPPGSEERQEFEKYFDTDIPSLMEDIKTKTPTRYHNLNRAIAEVVEEFNMVSFLPLNIQDENSITLILTHIDLCIQYGEEEEPKEPKDDVFFNDE